MNEKDIAEQAYKNGYNQALKDHKLNTYRTGWKAKFFEAKKEIERLTEENENLKADILRYADMEFTEKHCDLYSENEALKQWLKRLSAENEVFQKQVDELKEQLEDMEEQRDKQAYIAEDLIQEKHRWTEQAVKDTAKEITKILRGYNYDGEIDELIAVIEKRYGVEVK